MPSKILILNRWPQYRSSERWDNELARPEALIAHDRHRVSYICDPVGQRGVPDAAHDVRLIQDFSDTASVLAAVNELTERHGRFDHVIAFSEYLLDVAA